MSWSTRELADLADTTVNTVRHYHERGLLEVPDRRMNGYEQYGVPHLIRLLQIRRLRDIGVPIAEIERLDSGVGTSPEVLAAIDANLIETIERSQRARAPEHDQDRRIGLGRGDRRRSGERWRPARECACRRAR